MKCEIKTLVKIFLVIILEQHCGFCLYMPLTLSFLWNTLGLSKFVSPELQILLFFAALIPIIVQHYMVSKVGSKVTHLYFQHCHGHEKGTYKSPLYSVISLAALGRGGKSSWFQNSHFGQDSELFGFPPVLALSGKGILHLVSTLLWAVQFLRALLMGGCHPECQLISKLPLVNFSDVGLKLPTTT